MAAVSTDERPAKMSSRRTRPFGPLRVSVSSLGQGTWSMERSDREEAIRALRAGLDAGLTHVDTAEMYGDGAVERLVGEAIRGRRDEVFLVSKVLPGHASFDQTLRACDDSLERLGTDRLELYLLHWRGKQPLEETFRAFDALATAGKIRAFGVSNFAVRDLEEAIAIVGEGRIACNQVAYHLQKRGIERDVLPWCVTHDIAVVAYSPLGSARFPSAASSEGRVLEDVAAAHDVGPRQVALAFLLRHPAVFAIPKAAKAEHVSTNAATFDLELSEEEIRRIDSAFPIGAKRRIGADA